MAKYKSDKKKDEIKELYSKKDVDITTDSHNSNISDSTNRAKNNKHCKTIKHNYNSNTTFNTTVNKKNKTSMKDCKIKKKEIKKDTEYDCYIVNDKKCNDKNCNDKNYALSNASSCTLSVEEYNEESCVQNIDAVQSETYIDNIDQLNQEEEKHFCNVCFSFLYYKKYCFYEMLRIYQSFSLLNEEEKKLLTESIYCKAYKMYLSILNNYYFILNILLPQISTHIIIHLLTFTFHKNDEVEQYCPNHDDNIQEDVDHYSNNKNVGDLLDKNNKNYKDCDRGSNNNNNNCNNNKKISKEESIVNEIIKNLTPQEIESIDKQYNYYNLNVKLLCKDDPLIILNEIKSKILNTRNDIDIYKMNELDSNSNFLSSDDVYESIKSDSLESTEKKKYIGQNKELIEEQNKELIDEQNKKHMDEQNKELIDEQNKKHIDEQNKELIDGQNKKHKEDILDNFHRTNVKHKKDKKSNGLKRTKYKPAESKTNDEETNDKKKNDQKKKDKKKKDKKTNNEKKNDEKTNDEKTNDEKTNDEKTNDEKTNESKQKREDKTINVKEETYEHINKNIQKKEHNRKVKLCNIFDNANKEQTKEHYKEKSDTNKVTEMQNLPKHDNDDKQIGFISSHNSDFNKNNINDNFDDNFDDNCNDNFDDNCNDNCNNNNNNNNNNSDNNNSDNNNS
ncbi:N2227-like protein, putative, partial [Hepatocystis sp. ex Piliocolobus tephrosceles]